MLENIRGHSRGSIPPLRMPSPLPHDLCHEWNVSRRLPAGQLFSNTKSRLFWILYPVFHELWSVAIWLVGLGILFVSCEHWGLFPLSFLMVHSLKLFSRTDVLICWILGKDICKFPDIIVHFSPPWNSVLWMLATHVYLDFRLQLLNFRNCWGSAWVFPFCITSGNSLKVANWGNHRAHLICFLSHGPLSFVA